MRDCVLSLTHTQTPLQTPLLRDSYHRAVREQRALPYLVALSKKLDVRRAECQHKQLVLSCREPFCMESPERQNKRVQKRIVHSCCHRTCPCERCRAIRSLRASRRYELGVMNMRQPRLITLTFPRRFLHVNKENSAYCAECFKLLQQKLRRHVFEVFPAWGEPFRVRSDISLRHYLKVLEIAYDEFPDKEGEYHAAYNYHYHIIYDGVFISHEILQKYWESITGAFIVRIEMPRHRINAARYCLKYVAKGMFLDGGPDDESMSSLDYYLCARSIRFVCGYGLAKGKCPAYYYCPFCYRALTYDKTASDKVFKGVVPIGIP